MPSDNAPSFSPDAPHAGELETLKADLAMLREDLRALGVHAGESARSHVDQARMRVSPVAHAAKEKGLHARDQVQTQIEDHPFAAVGIAFGAGVLLGAILARR